MYRSILWSYDLWRNLMKKKLTAIMLALLMLAMFGCDNGDLTKTDVHI